MDDKESLKTAARREMEKWFGFPSGEMRAEFSSVKKEDGFRPSQGTLLDSLFDRSAEKQRQNINV